MFWINVAISLFIGMAIAALSPAIVWFYDEPRLLGITLAVAGASLLAGLSVQQQAILRRQMRFGALVGRDVAGTACGAITAVFLAWCGAGYWALVAQQVVPVGVRSALVWVASRWRPGPLAPFAEVRSMLYFGGHVTGARLVNTLARNLDKILIGRLWSAQLLGYYSKASNGMVVPFQQAGQALAGVAVLEMVTTMSRWVMTSLGLGTRLLRWRLFESVVKVLGLAIGVFWGAAGLAAGLAATSTVLILPALYYGLRETPVEPVEVSRAAWRPALAAALGAAVVLAMRPLVPGEWPVLAVLAVDASAFVAVYLGVWAILPRGRETLLELLHLAREFRWERRGSDQKRRRTPP
jgi:hypothetical protein